MKKHSLPLLLALVCLWIGCKLDKNDPEDLCSSPPKAEFTADKTSGDAPLTVTFINNSIGASDYLWTFESGSTASSSSPVYTFSTAATYPVMLIVTSHTGCKDTFTVNITVNSALPPTACFNYIKGNAGIAPSEVAFNSSCSQNAVSYLWDFGYLDSIAVLPYSSTEANPNHLFTKPGKYDVKLTTRNSVNDSSSTTDRIIICGINSNIVNDSCVCDPGYEGDAAGFCTVETRAKFLGNYSVTEDCSLSSPSTYTISVTAGATINEVKINNFWDVFINSVKATIAGSTITIASQEPDQDDFVVEGSGSIDISQTPNVMTITYTVTDTNGIPISDVCTNSMFIKL
ncbi:MAG: PKD domain-containing protein [Saprospiraceae bacterium]|nr:PKD domain-containing protein [Saprospiraceae bacterium]